jgi:hypothetical protein
VSADINTVVHEMWHPSESDHNNSDDESSGSDKIRSGDTYSDHHTDSHGKFDILYGGLAAKRLPKTV